MLGTASSLEDLSDGQKIKLRHFLQLLVKSGLELNDPRLRDVQLLKQDTESELTFTQVRR